MIPIRRTLTEMCWPQPPSPLQIDNSTTEGVVNNTIFPQKLNLWIYDFTGYAAAKHKVNSYINGLQAYWNGETTVPNIIHQIIMNSIARHSGTAH